MTKHIKRCERDEASLQKLRGLSPASHLQPQSYFDRVVIKPWGYEYLIFENDYVAAWLLHISKDQSTSMHCHPQKKTSLFALAGEALCNTFLRRYYLKAPDAVIIERGVFHSTKCTSADGLYLIEVETPPNKTDLVRLSDEYQRQGQGYEGLSEMKTERLERYDHFSFTEPKNGESQKKELRGAQIEIASYSDSKHFRSTFKADPDRFYCSCRGKIIDEEGSLVLDLGDVYSGEYLDSFKELGTDGPLVLLTVGTGQL